MENSITLMMVMAGMSVGYILFCITEWMCGRNRENKPPTVPGGEEKDNNRERILNWIFKGVSFRSDVSFFYGIGGESTTIWHCSSESSDIYELAAVDFVVADKEVTND